MPNKSVTERSTSNMRRLIEGDKFTEDGEMWEVVGEPETVDTVHVSVPMKRFPHGKASRRYVYNRDHRVKLVR